MKIFYKKKSIELSAKKVSELGKFTGLMFKPVTTKTLLFEFNKKRTQYIHSLFVFFPFLAVWLDEKNVVVKTQIIKPFRPHVSSIIAAQKLIEIPLNQKNEQIVSFFVDKSKDLNI